MSMTFTQWLERRINFKMDELERHRQALQDLNKAKAGVARAVEQWRPVYEANCKTPPESEEPGGGLRDGSTAHPPKQIDHKKHTRKKQDKLHTVSPPKIKKLMLDPPYCTPYGSNYTEHKVNEIIGVVNGLVAGLHTDPQADSEPHVGTPHDPI